MVTQPTIPSWEALHTLAQQHTPARRIRRSGQAPSSVPISTGFYKLADGAVPPVLLYRDSNSWCPFCERVWFTLEEKEIPFATEFIDLSHKPQWYVDLVPTTLVPAAQIEGTFVYESTAIVLALEERFAPALLPQDPAEQAIARHWIQAAEAQGSFLDDYLLLRKAPTEPEALAQLKATVEAKLDELETTLGQYPGDYFMSQFSLVDIMYSPLLDRLAANLPVYWGYAIKDNPRFPRLTTWFAALQQRPAYRRVKSDDLTNNLLMHHRYGVQPSRDFMPLDAAEGEAIANRAEAAERLCDNRSAAIADILKNSGVQALEADTPGLDLEAIVDANLRRLAEYLMQSDRAIWVARKGVDGSEQENKVGAIALSYIRNRICAPRDMSAGAATALRMAIDQGVAEMAASIDLC